MQIEEPPHSSATGWAPFALGFRPFFLAAGVSALVLLLIWLGELGQVLSLDMYYSWSAWHAHEMLFGYTAAVIAGFLLTAVRNWTDLPSLSGTPLMLLGLVWLAGRVLPFFSAWIPVWLIASVDLLFLPLVAVAVARLLFKRRQKSNYVFIAILGTMFLANLLVHLGNSQADADLIRQGLYLMLLMIMLIIVVMGGRVIPFFAERGVAGIQTRSWKPVEIMTGVSVLLLALAVLFVQQLVLWMALLAFVVHAIRLAGWYDKRIWQEPLVWVLIVGYGWIVLSFALLVLARLGVMSEFWAWHAFTVGGIGGITLGMMARVTLGHTGRMMKLPSGMMTAFVLINVAAIVRVILPMIFSHQYPLLLQIAGGLWILAFALFVAIYTPMWLRVRVDGRPG